ncbi:hypothetical protein BXZ70DRAFT_914862 [Cristinia sonorae]|uniref:Uncharacterized protein n=1 Tax=Cristinia sonorae TaxID=1940300 RepID=A0A8K0UZ35_9AGAR|nr:hypothetical protein BXZ70DRAFT_914862 [Cristinia sonorae]
MFSLSYPRALATVLVAFTAANAVLAAPTPVIISDVARRELDPLVARSIVLHSWPLKPFEEDEERKKRNLSQ